MEGLDVVESDGSVDLGRRFRCTCVEVDVVVKWTSWSLGELDWTSSLALYLVGFI